MIEKKVIVTGGAGFIGSHLVDRLITEGYYVYIVDDLSLGKLNNLKKWTTAESEYHDFEAMYRYSPGKRPRYKLIDFDITNPMVSSPWFGDIDEGEVECIFHLAARMDVMSSFKDPYDDGMTNYIGTLNVLEYARKIKCNKVILRSSFTVYSGNNRQPVIEDASKKPISPYALHKYASERILYLYNDHYGMKNAVFRLFNTYGPRQDPESVYAGVVMRFLDSARQKKDITIYSDGEQTRDFIYVEDVAEALYQGFRQGASGVYNVGTGKETTINDLAQLVREVTGMDINIIRKPERRGEITRSVADVTRIKNELGFEAPHDLKKGLEKTWEWFLEQ